MGRIREECNWYGGIISWQGTGSWFSLGPRSPGGEDSGGTEEEFTVGRVSVLVTHGST